MLTQKMSGYGGRTSLSKAAVGKYYIKSDDVVKKQTPSAATIPYHRPQ